MDIQGEKKMDKKILKDGELFLIEDGSLDRIVEALGKTRAEVLSIFEENNAEVEYDDFSGLQAGDPDVKDRWESGFVFAKAFLVFLVKAMLKEHLSLFRRQVYEENSRDCITSFCGIYYGAAWVLRRTRRILFFKSGSC